MLNLLFSNVVMLLWLKEHIVLGDFSVTIANCFVVGRGKQQPVIRK